MSATERVAERAARGIPTEITVVHPEKGRLTVKAFCGFDAKMQAAQMWELGAEELEQMKAVIRTESEGE